MARCIELARLGGSKVKTNPNVGALLLYEDKVIGEGFHKYYGGDHAEVEAVKSVSVENKDLIQHATLYVTLEPCCIHAKTPACSDLIIHHQIKKVVVGTKDPNPAMQGKSIQLLKSKGIEVIDGVLENVCQELIAPFRAHLDQRPYILIKYAQTSDNYIGIKNGQVWLSNYASKRLVHKWRSENDAILIGYNTALIDDPALTTRLYPGPHPHRVVLDRKLSLPRSHQLWADEYPTTFITERTSEKVDDKQHKSIETMDFNESLEENICKLVFKKAFYRLMIEGGGKTLQSFISKGLWDEARVIRTRKTLGSGIRAPYLKQKHCKMERFLNDSVYHYRRNGASNVIKC